MKIKTAELIGEALGWAVAIAEGLSPIIAPAAYGNPARVFVQSSSEFVDDYRYRPWQDWTDGGQLIDKHQFNIVAGNTHGLCVVKSWSMGVVARTYPDGETHLIAAMRAIVAARLGEEVEIPNELIEAKK